MREQENQFTKGIGYTEADLVSGWEWARSELTGFRQDLQSENELARDIA